MKLKRSRTIYTTVLVSVLSRFKIHVMLLLKNIKFSKYMPVVNFRVKNFVNKDSLLVKSTIFIKKLLQVSSICTYTST